MNLFPKISISVIFIFFSLSSLAFAQPVREPGDYILILNKSGNTAWQLDAETGSKVAEYATGTAPHEVAISPDQQLAAITNYGGRNAGNTLTVINLVERRVAGTIDLGSYRRPHGIQWFDDGQRVIVSVEAQQAVAIVNVETGTVESTIKTGQDVSHMVELGRGEQRVFVSNIGSGSVSVLNLQEPTLVKNIPTGEGAEGITLANRGDEVWVTNRAANSISVIDTESLEVTDELESSDFPIRAEVSPDNRFVAVSNARSSDISVFDPVSKKKIVTVSTRTEGSDNGVPIGMTFSSDSSTLYVANSEADRVVVIDTKQWKVTGTFKTGETPDGIAYFSIK